MTGPMPVPRPPRPAIQLGPSPRLAPVLTALVPVALVLATGCASGPDGAAVGEDPVAGAAVEVRFVLEVAAEDHPAVLVQATSESRSVGWLRVLRDGAPVHVEEQCGVPDCDAPGAVCGANVPTVREIAGEDEAGSIAYVWDGTWSVIDDVARCERREPAPAGEYVARLCYGHAAEAEGDPRSDAGALGYLTAPICVERPFELGTDADVVLRIP